MPPLDAPDRTPDSGRIGMPRIDAGMNKIAPRDAGGGKGSKSDDKFTRLGREGQDNQEVGKILARARKRFDKASRAEGDNRKAGLEDDQFYTGNQWPADIQARRSSQKRPCLTYNKLPVLVRQVTNEQRENRPAININPVGDRADVEVAKMYRGLIRFIERESDADTAYDTGFESAARKGWGYWLVTTEHSPFDPANPTSAFDLNIVIKRIRNAFMVYLDPDHQEPDGADAKWGFITENMTRGDFEDMYPDADPMPWPHAGLGDSNKALWITQDTIRVAKYYEIENESRWLVALSNGHVGLEDDLTEDVRKDIAAGRITVEQEREVDIATVRWYLLTAVEILKEGEWPGSTVPIVKIIGDEIDIEGKVTTSGIVRNAKDAQRAYNYSSTMEMELVALAPKAPWLVAEGQTEDYDDQWKVANTEPQVRLQYKPVSLGGQPVPPPQRQQMVMAPQGWEMLKQGAAQDLMGTTGIRFDATKSERMYDESGRALRELRRSGDIGSFHLIDNLARSLRRTGEICVEIIPKIYDHKRMATILREDDSEEQIQIDPSSPKPMVEGKHPITGKSLKIFNPTMGRYGVTVTIGPSYATKRIEAAESMMDFVRAIGPQIAPNIADLIAKNMDWPGSEEFATRLAKMLPPGLLTPEIKDVPPQVQAMLQSLDGQVKQLMQENVSLKKLLTDQQADRAIKQDSVDKTFEARLLAIVQKAEADHNATIAAELSKLAEGVTMLRDALMNPPQENARAG